MTQVENLDENLLPSLNDWIPIQPPGQKIKKVKIENLPINIDTTALQAEIDQKADINHSHTQFSDLQQQIDTKASQSVVNEKANSSDVTAALATKVDNTTLANTVSVLQQQLDGKAPNAHNHPISSITNLQTNLDSKSDVGHGHSISNVTGLQTALDGKINVGTVFNAFDYDQSAVPINPTTGKTWRERDSNNWIVRDWFYDGVDWQSIQEFFITIGAMNGQSSVVTTANTQTAGDSYGIALNNPPFLSKDNKGLYFIETCLHIGTGTPNDVSNYWRIRPAYIQTGTSTNLGGEYFTSELSVYRNIEKWLIHKLKVYREPTLNTNLSGLRMWLKSFGSPGQLVWSANTSYRLIRQS